MQVTVDRGRWLNGTTAPMDCCLLDKSGKMCILGFYGAAAGVEEQYLYQNGSLIDPHFGAAPNLFELAWLKNGVEERITGINDDRLADATRREQQLQHLFGDYGIELQFIGASA